MVTATNEAAVHAFCGKKYKLMPAALNSLCSKCYSDFTRWKTRGNIHVKPIVHSAAPPCIVIFSIDTTLEV
jgi:hypothetical protein